MILATTDSVALDVHHLAGVWTVTARWFGRSASGTGPTREAATAAALVALARVVTGG